MKTTKTNKLIAVLIMTIIISICNTVLAQIKIAGDDYSQKLTGSKSYYDRDVDFDKYFPTITEKESFSRITPDGNTHLNMIGDTIYVCGEQKHRGMIIKNGLQGYESAVITIPEGYYTISGYVFCTDNADSIRKNAGLGFICNQPNAPSECKSKSIRALKEEILVQGNSFMVYNLLRYQLYVALNPLNDDTTMYYIGSYPYGSWRLKTIHLKYYNQLVGFIGKYVYLKLNPHSGELLTVDNNSGTIIMEGITGDIIKLEDEKYEVIDVVLKNTDVYIVLKGENTGSFSLNTTGVYWLYSTNDLFGVFDEKTRDFHDYMDMPIVRACCKIPPRDKYSNPYKEVVTIITDKDWDALELRAKKTREQQEKEKKLRQQQEKQEKANREAAHKQQMLAKYGSQFGELIANKQVALGMTKDMCRDAWGNPMNIYRTTTSFGQSEVWCYNYKTMIYFFEGKVVQIDD